jgi:hypothetical protein
LAFIRRRNPIPTNPSRAVGTARNTTSPFPEEPESRTGKLMASMVEPAELSGCVGLGAEALVVGAEVGSAFKAAEAIEAPVEDPVLPKPLDEKSGELGPPKDP